MKNSELLLASLLLIFTINVYSQWMQVSSGMGNIDVRALAVKGNIIFAGGSGLYLSTNNGTSWTQTTLINYYVRSLAVNVNNIYAGCVESGSGVYKSTNNGTNWSYSGLQSLFVLSLAVNENNILAGVSGIPHPGFYPDGVRLSTDNGTSWTQTSLNRSAYSLAVNGNNIFAGTISNGVYLSTNNGTNWIKSSLNNVTVRSLTVNENNVFAGSDGNGVFISSNNGTNWTQTSLNNQTVRSLAVNSYNIFAGTSGSGVYVSNNNGANWTQRNDGLGNLNIRALCILNNYVFAGTESSVYRRPLGELVGIQPISTEIPNQYSLSQNYPNPFNPVTKIRFDISGASVAQTFLSVYDLLGREIATLVNEQLKPGTYEVEFDGFNYPSGVYYYKLTAGDFSQSRKMILVK